MKKSELRKIIKESIKELINEQQAPPPNWPSGPNWATLWNTWTTLPPGQSPSPPQAFLNRMANLGCNGKMQRYQILTNKMTSLFQGMNPNTGAQTGTSYQQGGFGSNPLWQGLIMSKLNWLSNDLQNNC